MVGKKTVRTALCLALLLVAAPPGAATAEPEDPQVPPCVKMSPEPPFVTVDPDCIDPLAPILGDLLTL